jgi:flagellar motor switch protein FliM
MTLDDALAAGLPDRRSGRQKDIKGYDFRRPEKFSRDQLRTLQGVHEQFVRLAGPALAGYLRTGVQFALEGVVQTTYQDFTADMKGANLVFVVSLDPLPAPILVEISAELVFASLDRLLGGVGRPYRPEREATEFERALFQQNWLMPALEGLRGAWASIVEITPVVGAVETGSNFVQIGLPVALPMDVVVAMEASAVVGDARGLVRLCYTYAALEPIAPQLDIRQLLSPGAKRRRPSDREGVRQGLQAVSVPVVVRLGTAAVSIAEVLDLQAGDVVRLDTLLDHEVDVLVDGRPKYRARPGLKRQHLAVRLTTVLDDEDGQKDAENVDGTVHD